MIAVDTNIIIAYFTSGAQEYDLEVFSRHLEEGEITIAPTVLTEIFSKPPGEELLRFLRDIPMLPITEHYWQRAGLLRHQLLKRGLKARLADALIAQSCIDHKVPLLTRDVDFRHFEKHCGLKLVKPPKH